MFFWIRILNTVLKLKNVFVPNWIWICRIHILNNAYSCSFRDLRVTQGYLFFPKRSSPPPLPGIFQHILRRAKFGANFSSFYCQSLMIPIPQFFYFIPFLSFFSYPPLFPFFLLFSLFPLLFSLFHFFSFFSYFSTCL